MIHLEVAVAAPMLTPLTYQATASQQERIIPGIRVLVPLGARQVTGYVLSILSSPVATDFQIKNITAILDSSPIFLETQIPFFRWIASYYQTPLGEVIRSSLPGGLTSQSGRTATLNEKGLKELENLLSSQSSPIADWQQNLLRQGHLKAAALRKIWSTSARKKLEKWQEMGWLEIKDIITPPTTTTKTEICVTLNTDINTEVKLKPSEKKTYAILCRRNEEISGKAIPRRELTREYPGAGKALKSLSEKNLVTLGQQVVYRDPFGECPPFFPAPEILTEEQQEAVGKLTTSIQAKSFSPFLLHGVTGSGKTEVYLQAVGAALKAGRTALILVPEIALATQLEGHFLSRFGPMVALLHSGLSKGERFDQWMRIINGKARIVLGARSAIFAPLASPGVIIVDEEHDGAYKQEERPRYQARDLAILLGSLENSTVILGSATPSLISYTHALNGKYQLITMAKRIGDRRMPLVEIIDLKNSSSGPDQLFSTSLRQALQANLEAGNQSLLFLNRRGYASLMLCLDCGKPVRCKNCDISLTLHKAQKTLRCHYCDFHINSATICVHCRSSRIKEIGFGTERVEAELHKFFPKARIARLDRDTSGNRRKFITTLKAVLNREIDILIGTQMIAKGHHFPHVTLVGVIWADAGLGVPDYKAGERTFQLISQVTGRAGRGDLPGRVIIQTHQPDHYTLTCSQNHDYFSFYQKEIALRKALWFPPFSRIINLRFSGPKEEDVRQAAEAVAVQARKQAAGLRLEILGPAAAPLARLRNRYRWQILVKGNTSGLQSLCRHISAHPAALVRRKKVTLSFDIDPENML